MSVQWFESEWNDHKEAAGGWLNGIMADVYPAVDWDTDLPTGQWDWDVKASSDRCEWPELIDSGTCATVSEAKRKAEDAMRKADATYPHISYS